MKQKTKDFREWQQTEEEGKFDRERAAKQKEKDEEANKYQVLENGQVVHETPNDQEAIRMAKKINGKVLWVICEDGDRMGIRIIYPETT